jgi:alanine racemase
VPRRGDPVIFLNEDIGVDDFASHAGTIGYEVLVRLGRRFRRVYDKS